MVTKREQQERSAEKTVRDRRRANRRRYYAGEKIRIVLEGLRGEDSLPSCVVGKGLTPACIPGGARTSWRPARSVWRG
jgi:transposase